MDAVRPTAQRWLSVVERSSLVLQSEEIQGNTQKMLKDLIELSETNQNAEKVIQKYGISENQ